MIAKEKAPVGAENQHKDTKNYLINLIPTSANPIDDIENMIKIAKADYIRAKESTKIPLSVLQEKKEMYFLGIGVWKLLHSWQFYGNENFELFNEIKSNAWECETAPEITGLVFRITLSPNRKSVAQYILEHYEKIERSDL